ncbi:hypothetical protein NE237_009029 [Protea cynaroides]|uniref:Uncharacterized protein n=1 Tax=Protea cynaroides TaxID=273540 RepID=A0A9Q0KXT5_9MAGN|nr:hypothetical protein NE237_009029 [Protea cynaroides]
MSFCYGFSVSIEGCLIFNMEAMGAFSLGGGSGSGNNNEIPLESLNGCQRTCTRHRHRCPAWRFLLLSPVNLFSGGSSDFGSVVFVGQVPQVLSIIQLEGFAVYWKGIRKRKKMKEFLIISAFWFGFLSHI